MGKDKVREHFISRFIIENFADKKGKVRVINKTQMPIKPYSALPESLFYTNDLYETRNNDGSYFDRNAIENDFANFEGRMSAELPQIIQQADDRKKLTPQQIKCLADFVAFQLIRLPFILKLFKDSNSNLPDITERNLQTNAMYRIIIGSPDSAFDYMKNNDFPLSEEAKNNIRSTKANTLVYDFINTECNVYLIKAMEDGFCIGDNPVLINAFDNARFIFPISPQFAIVCSLTEPDDTEEYNTIRYVKKDTVSTINQKTIERAERFIVFSYVHETYMTGMVQQSIKGV